LLNVDTSKMWIKVWITIFVVGFAYGKNFEKCPNYPDDNFIPYCDTSNCQLPDCACAGQEPEVLLKDRPQIVYLTFDDAMTGEFDKNFYEELFMPNISNNGDYKYTNPNGCPIRSTFFVTAKSNEYPVTNKYWRNGHEIAAHSITHRSNTTYWKTIDTKQWEDEMYGVKQMINKFAKVPLDDIVGIRTPYLQSGGDEMLQMMENKGFEYDCSSPSRLFGYTNMNYGRWPFTYDWYNDMDCQIEPCPKCDFPGIWSQPILDFEDGRDDGLGHGYPCGMTDTCQVQGGGNSDSIYNMLMKNFDRAYNGYTRSPIGIYIHSAWFVYTNSWHFEGYKKFLDHIMAMDDVWIVPIKDGIEYMKNGSMTNDNLINGDFEPFNCDKPFPTEPCPGPTECPYTVDNEDIIGPIDYRLRICGLSCPRNFPWLGNPLGQ